MIQYRYTTVNFQLTSLHQKGMKKMKLTKAQKEVVSYLKENSKQRFLWTTETSSLQAWIGDKNGNMLLPISFQTAESLFKKGRIRFENADFINGLFQYELVG